MNRPWIGAAQRLTDADYITLAPQAKRLDGHVFGKLTVTGPVGRGANGDAIWHASCECGGEIRDRAYNLRKYGGCGCLQATVGDRSLKHGHARHSTNRSPTYRSWRAMKDRCSAKSGRHWEYYASKGVTVCERWNSFENFLADMGERPDGKTIDRIDPCGNYEPGNCRWATAVEQASNKRSRETSL